MKEASSEGVPFLQDQRGKKLWIGLLNLDHIKSSGKFHKKRQRTEADRPTQRKEKRVDTKCHLYLPAVLVLRKRQR